jgi:hypothetical protein
VSGGILYESGDGLCEADRRTTSPHFLKEYVRDHPISLFNIELRNVRTRDTDSEA